MTETIAGRGFRLRRAGAEDVGFLVDLAAHPEIEPFLAGMLALGGGRGAGGAPGLGRGA